MIRKRILHFFQISDIFTVRVCDTEVRGGGGGRLRPIPVLFGPAAPPHTWIKSKLPSIFCPFPAIGDAVGSGDHAGNPRSRAIAGAGPVVAQGRASI